MAGQDQRTPHWAVEELERRYIGQCPTGQEREEPFWPRGTERLYGYSPENLATGPAFDPRCRGHGPRNYQRSRERILCGEVDRKADKRPPTDQAVAVTGVHDVHGNIRVRR